MFLYIDPGTGSMLLSLFIGIATAAVFGLRALFIKLQFIFTGGKKIKDETANNIPYVIFSDHKRYWNVFKPICDEAEKRKIPVVFYTMSADDPGLSAKYDFIKAEFIGEGNKAFAKLNMLHADILLATTPNLDVYQWKRSKNVKCYVHVPHSADELAGYRMFGLDYYDAVLTTGKNQVDLIRTIESLRPAIAKKEFVQQKDGGVNVYACIDWNTEHFRKAKLFELDKNRAFHVSRDIYKKENWIPLTDWEKSNAQNGGSK